MPVQLALMSLALLAGGVFILVGQKAMSERTDPSVKTVSNCAIFLNGEPVGRLSYPAPIEEKIDRVRTQGVKRGLIDKYTEPDVLVVAGPDVAVGALDEVSLSITAGTGSMVLVGSSALNASASGKKPNPLALIFMTEGVDDNKARNLSFLSSAEMAKAGPHVIISSETSPVAIQASRTYRSTIEIGSDGRFYFNEQTGHRETLAKDVIATMGNTAAAQQVIANYAHSNSNAALPVMPLKQRPLTLSELPAAVKILLADQTVSPTIPIIVSDKAPYSSLLQLIDAIGDPNVSLDIVIRKY